MRTLLVLVGVLWMGHDAARAADPKPGSAPQVGASYPVLRLPTIDRQRTLDLRSLRGKKVLLIEFASW